ncbi:rod-determining factor RdfA [Halobacterium yunchengense]|uniref:rod-determining factor RdfA n=1 Tax=Halobacterium yunchengense TaxID=3108497 RepID=UPI0030095EC7
MADGERDAGGRRSKVARVIDEYDLHGLGEELEARWTATGDDHWSLRDLAAHVNEAVVRERLRATGANPSEAYVESVVGLLTGDGGGGADETHLRRRLEREGVDVDGLAADLVTYQAVRSYLREYRGAEYEREVGDRVAAASTAVQKLRGRLTSVTESKLEQLRSTARITLGEFRVMVDVQVLCTDCNTQRGVAELLAAGGCDCEDEGGE